MSKKTLVIGASEKTSRYSNLVIHKLKQQCYEVYAIGLKKGNVSGMDITTDMVFYKDINTVTLYINPLNQKEYYDYIVSLKPNRVIFNPGTENPEFYKILEENKIPFEVACTLTLLATNQY